MPKSRQAWGIFKKILCLAKRTEKSFSPIVVQKELNTILQNGIYGIYGIYGLYGGDNKTTKKDDSSGPPQLARPPKT